MIAIATVSMCVMAGCGSKDGSKEKADVEQVAEEDDSDAKKAIVGLVNAVYDDINAVSASSSKPNIDLIGKYCSKEFRELVSKICEIDRNKPADEGFGMNNDLWSFYEPPFEVENNEVDVDSNEGSVCYQLRKGGEKVDMIYSVVCEDGEWRFSDCERIGMMAGSWVDRMTDYIEENQ